MSPVQKISLETSVSHFFPHLLWFSFWTIWLLKITCAFTFIAYWISPPIRMLAPQEYGPHLSHFPWSSGHLDECLVHGKCSPSTCSLNTCYTIGLFWPGKMIHRSRKSNSGLFPGLNVQRNRISHQIWSTSKGLKREGRTHFPSAGVTQEMVCKIEQ